MTTNGWLQILIYGLALLVLTRPLGGFLYRVFEGQKTLLSPVLGPVERGIYRLTGVDSSREQGWLSYTLAMLLFNLLGFLFLYALLRLQGVLPLNPQGLPGVSPHLAFNTAISFVTNTNWQSYGGESTLSYLSQMLGLTTQNFVSAATGLAIAAAVAAPCAGIRRTRACAYSATGSCRATSRPRADVRWLSTRSPCRADLPSSPRHRR